MIKAIGASQLTLLFSALVGLTACGPMSASHFEAATARGELADTGPQPSREQSFTPSTQATPQVPRSQPPAVSPVVTAPATASVPKPAAAVIHQAPLSSETMPKSSQSKLPIPAWAQTAQGASWTRMTAKAIEDLGGQLVQAEIQDAMDFCPPYRRLEIAARELVWIQLISSMAKYESEFKPFKPFVENFRGSDHKLVVSRGLLQISKGSANSYGCNIQNEVQLDDPETNLRCGVRILSTLVSKYHAIHGLQSDAPVNTDNPWRGAARYWSVLRGKAKDLMIRASVRQLAICRA